MKRLLVAVLAASTAIGGVLPASVAAAEPGHGHGYGHGRHGGYGPPERWDRDTRHWREQRGYHYWGGRYGYEGYHGHWRAGQYYPYWRNPRYVIYDYRAYDLPPPPPGYGYYRDGDGDVVMAAIASGVIGLIIGGALADYDHDHHR